MSKKRKPSAWLYKELRSTGSYSPPYLAQCLSVNKPDERFAKDIQPLYTLKALGLKELP